MNPANGPVLRDIHLPPPPGWWPPAPGWWLLALACIVCAVVVLVKWRRRQRLRRWRRDVLAEFDGCIDAAHGDPAVLAAALSRFLRRVTLRRDARAAAFSGERWLTYLDAQVQTEEFSLGVGRVLIDAPFRPVVHYDAAALIALVRRWVRAVLAKEVVHA
jgi:Domain of unknown function (DUF4381)